MDKGIDLKSLPDPGTKYSLGMKIGGGVGGDVYEAVEIQTGKKVAIKIVEFTKDTEDEIKQEYHVLKEFSNHENLPEFYGIYLKKTIKNAQKIWFVIELCEGGTAKDLVRKLGQKCQKMNELHIAYILRETIKAVVHLHENNICHGDIRGSNIMLTIDGKVKLIDYGISRCVDNKMKDCIGSPGWLAPEVIACQGREECVGYNEKIDVWGIGVTAIELGDGLTPFENMHPGRALFQIIHNPPPLLRKPTDWSQLYNDFIAECLVKSPENRPFVQELLEHTFFGPINKAENLMNDLKTIIENERTVNLYKEPDIQVRNTKIKIEKKPMLENILQEDLAALTEANEDIVLAELYEKFKKNEYYTYIGDILLIVNPNKEIDLYGNQYHEKYKCKAKSQNAPHIYSLADSAYRDVFHHEKPQHILFAGETGSGKSVSMMHAIDHLLFMGEGLQCSEKVKKGLKVIQSLGNAATAHNPNSTRHILHTQVTFTDTGKVSGAVFRVFQLEKGRVTTTSKKQANFNIFYYFYDTMKAEEKFSELFMDDGRDYKFLKAGLETGRTQYSEQNIYEYLEFEKNLRDFELEEEHIQAIRSILSAILLIGEIEFTNDDDGNGVLTTTETVQDIATLLGVDKKKLSWALLNYCFIVKGEAMMKHNSKVEANEAKNVLARGIYSRLVDWIVNFINEKLSISRVIYGDKHIISLLDFYGFECYKKNTLDQLFVNIINEQLQFHYNQKIFTWEKQIAEEEEIPIFSLDFNDNKAVVDQILSKPDGLVYKIDEATRNEDNTFLIGSLQEYKPSPKTSIFPETAKEFSINHYTGKVTYDTSDIPEKNRDFLPPELIETMRLSSQDVVKQLFSSLLTKSGNLSLQTNLPNIRVGALKPGLFEKKKRNKESKVNTTPHGQFSQSRQMRTAATTFRETCFGILHNLTLGESGFHFVRCVRTDLSDKPDGFQPEVVRQQLRALGVVDTILATQQGYSYSVSYNEFIRRYKFLAFDFDENVEETKENCRLLLLRLKMEGWTMGKTKVFLKYYNIEYLSRLYETQIKKIVKVQSMMRSFMTRRKLYAKIRKYQGVDDEFQSIKEENALRLRCSPEEGRIIKYSNLTESQKDFIKPWVKRWKAKSIFQVLLLYRAERLQTLVNFCLQIHLFNQNFLSNTKNLNEEIELDQIDVEARPENYFKPIMTSVRKVPFDQNALKLNGDLTINSCEPIPDCSLELMKDEIIARLEKAARETKEKLAKETSAEPLKIFEDKEIQTDFTEEIKFSKEDSNTELKQTKINIIVDPPRRVLTRSDELENNIEEDTLETDQNSNINYDETSIEGETVHKAEQFPVKPPPRNIKKNRNIKENNVNKVVAELGQSPINIPPRNPLKTDQKTKAKRLAPQIPKPSIPHKEISPKKSPSLKAEPTNEQYRFNIFSSRPLPPKPNYKTSIQELEAKFPRKKVDDDSDEPPYNFKALLRKTDVSLRDKNSNDNWIFQSNSINKELSEKRKSLTRTAFNIFGQTEMVVTEIAPGILIHGQVTDL